MRVGFRLGLCEIPHCTTHLMDLGELRHPTDVRPPAKVVDDEAPHAHRLCGVGDGRLVGYACGPDDAHNGVMAGEGCLETVERVLHPLDGYVGRKRSCGLEPGDDS